MTTVTQLLFGTVEQGIKTLDARAGPLTAMLRGAPGVAVAPADVATAITDLLDVPLGNLALAAWDQQRRVRAALDETRRQPGSRQVVRLLEHTISSTQHPTLDVESGPVRARLLSLTLDVAIAINATELVIEGGRVVEVRAGAASASASLSAGHVTLAQRQLSDIDLGFHRALRREPAEVGSVASRRPVA